MESLENILTESELEQLTAIQNKIRSKISEDINSNIDKNILEDTDVKSKYAFDDINKPEHLTGENYELTFYVRAEATTLDPERKQFLSVEQCLDESFHIPVPSGTNLSTKINDFMVIFENTLGNLAQKINKING
jgi:hypothetical protein